LLHKLWGRQEPGLGFLGVDTVVCSCIFFLALIKGEKGYTLFDWVALILALVSILLWWITNSPLLSVLLITCADACGFFPTFRKSFKKPFEESMNLFVLSSLKFVGALLALQTYSLITPFYPAALICMNSVFVIMLLIRRKQLLAQAL